MTFLGLLIVIAIACIIWKAFTSDNKIRSQYICKSFTKKDYENDVNKFIKNMRCEYCDNYKKPIYIVDRNNKEIINCCCERFSLTLQNRILRKNFGRNSEYSNRNTVTSVPNTVDVKQKILPKSPTDKPLLTIKRPIFNEVDISKLGDSPIEQAIKGYEHSIVACHIGSLDSGNKYALIIGTSDEWVNVITYNWARQPVYQEYGFSTNENRWSYGSNVLGAPQIREVINDNLSEIKAIMATQERVRQEKAIDREKKRIEEEQAILEEERKDREEQALLAKIQAIRKQYIDKYFYGLEFQYNNNKRNHDAAQKDISSSYYTIDLLNQTCSCNDFRSRNPQYQLNDVRRLCRHLNQIIKDRELLRIDKDQLKNFVIQNIRGNTLGIHIGTLSCDKIYSIIAYSWTNNIFVATPKKNKDEFIMITWSLENDRWIPNKGGHTYNQQIEKKLYELFGREQNVVREKDAPRNSQP